MMTTSTGRVSWSLVTGPASEPVTLAEAKTQARVTASTDDTSITAYITVAREAAEEFMARGLFTQTWKLTRPDFVDAMYLPRAAPLQSATIQYYDASNTLQTLSPTYYTVDTVSRPGRIVRAVDQQWPAVHPDRLEGGVIITYVIGWTTTATIPERIKQGIRMFITYLQEDREGTEAAAAQARASAEACWTDVVGWIET